VRAQAGVAAGTGPGGLERRRAERVPMPPTGGLVSVVGAHLAAVLARLAAARVS